MIDRYFSLLESMSIRPELRSWVDTLQKRIPQAFQAERHGHFAAWRSLLNGLPIVATHPPILNTPAPRIEAITPLSDACRTDLRQHLLRLLPWRKGPFDLLGISIDSEWRSDLKWARVQQALGSLQGLRLLDVGCGNGYYLWRAKGDGAALAVGVDPYLLFVMQNHVIGHFMGEWAAPVLPVGAEDLPNDLESFDVTLSMGIFYHRRSPFEHLAQLRSTLRPGGRLLLETLVIDGGEGEVLVPDQRYAKMNNVWFIPSVAELIRWLKRAGLTKIEVTSCVRTDVGEQRRTDWMPFESLGDYLDPHDSSRTVEGYPAPTRAMLCAERPT